MKPFIKLVREIRAAKLAGLIEDYCTESNAESRKESTGHRRRVCVADTILWDKNRSYIKIKLRSDITMQTAEALKAYLLNTFYDIEKIVLFECLCYISNGKDYFELLIFPKQSIQISTQLCTV